MHRLCSMVILILAVSMLVGTAWAEGEKLVARPLTPQEIHDFELPEGTQHSAGLFTVGVGQPVYLEALVEKEASVSGVTWTLAAKPSGSDAALQPSPLGPEIPIYSPGNREVHDVAGRQLLVPDVTGQYTVDVAVGDTMLTANITAATYVGVGTVGGTEPEFPQCAMCHPDIATLWAATGHATMFEEAIDGLKSSHYNAGCLECHTVGLDEAPGAVNGGFDDVASDVGWSFPVDEEGEPLLMHGNWDAVPEELKAVSNIQCENCHGPGSEHQADPAKTSISLSAGDCGVCHDEQPYHTKNLEWNNSRHAVATRYPTGEGRESCVACHSGVGFIQMVKTGEIQSTEWEAITCQVCHDPHDPTNPYQLREVGDVLLGNGEVVTEGGTGKLCMNCHKSRRNVDEYVLEFHRHYGPHHGPQGDMIAGTGAVEYGGEIASTGHIYATEDGCASCHMQGVARDDPAHLQVGAHTFRMVWDAGTPDAPEDDVDRTAVCVDCHGPMDSFDLPRADYDGDGDVEGVQTEVKDLMEVLAMALPPVGENAVEVVEEYTPEQLKAAYNYEFVLEDKSYGIHNTKYTVGMLKASIKDLTGERIVTAVDDEAAIEPLAYDLAQNYPNPFNPTTHIEYSLPTEGAVRLVVTDALGQTVRELVNGFETAGRHTVTWDGRDVAGSEVATGIYFYRLESNGFRSMRKMVLVR